ncbi:MAG TPA: nodulation protein NfeD [Bacteroidales bacterium]|nr:nodulation protein NfeD [Bacteroidales bacterium]
MKPKTGNFFTIWIFLLTLAIPSPAQSQGKKVVVISVDGTINPASAEYVISGISQAEEQDAECLVIKLNTPGGLLASTRTIVTGLLEADIPVVVFVTPDGAQAASAGVFITLAAHVAVMSHATNIGAAHPVSMQGQQDSIMNEKATNDAAAFIRTISEERSRNVQWAENAVRNSISITASEALKEGVIDTIADSMQDLLEILDGRIIRLPSGEKKIESANAQVVEIGMSFRQKILNLLSDPNIAYILLMIGIYGILFELYSPGAILPGIAGAISLILAFYSLQTLPVNYAGVAFIFLAVILFLVEIKVVSHGLLALGGVISLILGSIMLIETESALEVMKVSWQVIVLIVLLTVAFFTVAIGFAIRAQRRKPTTGAEGIVGETGTAISDLDPSGQVNIHGELWRAESMDGTVITKGSVVVVVSILNLKLFVKKNKPN